MCDGMVRRAVVSVGFDPSYWNMSAGPVIVLLSHEGEFVIHIHDTWMLPMML